MANELSKAAWYCTQYRTIFAEVTPYPNGLNCKLSLNVDRAPPLQSSTPTSFSGLNNDSPPLGNNSSFRTFAPNESFQPWVTEEWTEAEKEEAEAIP